MSTRTATDQFLQDHDWLNRDNGVQGGGDESENDADDADEDKGDKSNSDNDPIQGRSGGCDLGCSGGDGEGLRGSEELGHGIDVDIDDRSGDEEPGTGDVDDNDRSGDEEEDYGYRYLVNDEDDEDSNEPLDIVDDALGPEDGEGDVDEANLLSFTDF